MNLDFKSTNHMIASPINVVGNYLHNILSSGCDNTVFLNFHTWLTGSPFVVLYFAG